MVLVRRAALIGALAISLIAPATARCQPAGAQPWLADRGTGVWTSIFGTYVRHRELLISPFFEYYYDNNFEYKPAELGHALDQDFRGRFRASEGLIFLAYGVTDRLAIEFEAAGISATLEKASADPSTLPQRFTESGRGDWQAELDWRMLPETRSRPEVFSYFEVSFPSNRQRPLIGTSDYEYKLGGGLIRGLRWGTLAARASVLYSQVDQTADVGDFAVEYLKRVSPRWRLYAGFEGSQDELELIGETQWHASEHFFLRINLGRGLSSKATDWAPDVGVVFTLPPGRGISAGK